METRTFRTNLNCESCVESVAPHLNSDPEIQNWKVNTSDDRKVLSVSGNTVDPGKVRGLVKAAGFEAYEEIVADADEAQSTFQVYFPLMLILVYLVGFSAIAAMSSGNFELNSLMSHFMGGFFVVFSFFKFLNLKGFADSYQTYDVLAKHSRAYAYLYPFIELWLGIAYLISFDPVRTNIVTIFVMGISSIGVIQGMLQKRKIRCACLGAFFNLPMSTVTLTEDALMIVMACAALLMK